MPSPFPGMDPFLEHPHIFADLHDRMHIHMSEALQAKLPAPYFAVVSERLWVETTTRYIESDTNVLYGPERGSPHANGGAVAVAEPRTRTNPLVVEVEHDERREGFVEIRTRDKDGAERVVTSIEILSLSNKMPGEKSRELYQKKQREVLASPIHLVEIDLLRGGEHATALPRICIESRFGPFDYHVTVNRFVEPDKYYVYPVRLAERLPEISVPLLPRDGSVPLDLQIVFDRCYDAGPYRRRIRYDLAQIVPPLTASQAEWAARILQEQNVAAG